MENGMSLSDIAAVTRGANDENGWGSGWFLIVVLFLFMFGFGGNGWNRQGEFGEYATAASQQEILFGQQFGQMNDRLPTSATASAISATRCRATSGSWARRWRWRRVAPT